MKNPLKLIWKWFLKQFRKRELKKRDAIYDDVTNTLNKLNQEKATKQQELIDEIKANWRRISGQHYGSKFIPGTYTKPEEVLTAINTEYFFKMQDLGITITKDFKFICK